MSDNKHYIPKEYANKPEEYLKKLEKDAENKGHSFTLKKDEKGLSYYIGN